MELSQFLEAEKKLKKIGRLGLKKSGGIRKAGLVIFFIFIKKLKKIDFFLL